MKGLAPEEHSILLTDATLDSRASRERLTHLLFENLGVPAMNIIQASVLDLLFTGTSTGVAVHLEGGLTNVVAVKDGHPLPDASYSFDVGGSDLTDYMRILLVDRGYELSNRTYEEIIPQIKESLCYVALDYSDELSKVSRRYDFEKTYELPDGQVISLFEELFQVPEVLFKPSLISREYPGIHYAAYNAIMRCDASIQEALFSNIVLAGPDSLYPGIAERLESELKAIAPPSTVINVVADPQRRYASWLGGSMLANSNSSNGDWWMSREEYKTHGPQLIHSKY